MNCKFKITLPLILMLLLMSTVQAQLVPSDLMSNCNQWKITYPDGVEDKTLCGETNNEYFHVNDAGDALVFFAPVRSDNGTTPNSDYIRSELRERTEDGGSDIYWTTTGKHVLYVKQAITHLPLEKPHLVATQIHGDKFAGIDDALVLRLENSHLFLSFNGEKLRSDVTVKTDYVLGTVHEVIFEVIDDKHYVYYSEDGNLKSAYLNGTASAYLVKDEGNEVLMDLNYDKSYFKVGNYTQSNPEKEGDKTDDPDNYGEVLVYDFFVQHGETGPVSVASVNLSPSNTNVSLGNTIQLSTSITPSNAANQAVSYSSNNTAVASVSSNGLVTGHSEGTATITVTTDDGSYQASATITVQDIPQGLSNIALNKSVTATVAPEATNPVQHLVDGSTDSRCSASGFPQTFTIDLGGMYDISYTELVCYQDRAYQYTIEIASNENGPYTPVVDRTSNSTPGSVTSPITDQFSANGQFLKLTITDANTYTGNWVSILEFRAFGEASTTSIPVTGVSLSPSTVELTEGESYQLSATISPANADDKSVSYSSSNASVATVNANGLVTAVSNGTATILVSTTDGQYTDASTITVTSPSVDLAPYDITKFKAYLAACKLQSPTSTTEATPSEIVNGYSSSTFYVVDGDKVAFNQSGSLKRTELRQLENWYVNDLNQTFHTNLKIEEQTCEQLTFVQIHDDANVGNGPNKPLLRIYRSTTKSPTNHIWAAVKTDASGINTTHIDLGETPSNYFDCDVTIEDGAMIISINGTEMANEDVSYWAFPSYWKNGVYLQDEGEAITYFNEISLSTDAPVEVVNLALNKSATATNEQSTNPASNAIDGDPDSRWSAAGYTQSLEVDLGAIYSVNGTEVVCFNDRAYQYVVEVSTDGNNYTQVVNRSNNTTAGTNDAPIADNFSFIEARYVRISVSGAANYTGSWISIEELRVFGKETPVEDTEVETTTEIEISSYPNPVDKSQLTIEVSANAGDVLEVLILDNIGNVQYQSTNVSNGDTIDVSSLDNDNYILQVITENGVVTDRFQKI